MWKYWEIAKSFLELHNTLAWTKDTMEDVRKKVWELVSENCKKSPMCQKYGSLSEILGIN